MGGAFIFLYHCPFTFPSGVGLRKRVAACNFKEKVGKWTS